MIRLDFETRSKVDLKKVGAWIYSLHPSTQIISMSYQIGNKKTKLWRSGCCWPFEEDPWPTDLDYHIGALKLIEAHNTFFEYCIWVNKGMPDHSFPKLPVKVWRCSAAKAASYGLPRKLEKACKAIKTEVQKDMDGHRVMLQVSRPRKPSKKDPSLWFDDETRMKKVYAYNKDDVKCEHGLSVAIPKLSKHELKLWKLDQKINRRGVHCDTELVIASLRIIEILEKKSLKRIKELTNGQVETPGQIEKIIEYCADNWVFLDNLQAKTIENTLKEEIPTEVKEILEIRQLMSKASVKKFQAMLNRVDPNDNRIRELLRYYGAERTGRWSGSGIQIQNFVRGKFKKQGDIENIIELIKDGDIEALELIYGNVTEALSSILRSCLCASPGKTLIAGDFKSIEYIVLCWLADCIWAVSLFRKGGDPYRDLATEIYSIPLKKVDDDQRFIGKQGILGLGYGMGWKKFKKDLKEKFDIIIKAKFSKQIVKTYRDKYWAVTELWKSTEHFAIRCVVDKCDYEVAGGLVKWEYSKKTLNCILPSGRKLYYHKPKLTPTVTPWGETKLQLSYMGIHSQSKKWVRLTTYGGKLVENIVQAISRDLLADAMLRIEKEDLPIVLSVHDEAVSEVEPEKADLEKYLELMCILPKWANGLPIKAEGWKGQRFRKD